MWMLKLKERQQLEAVQACSFRKPTDLTRLGYQRNYGIRRILEVINTPGDIQEHQ
jgi:hypothetical protein